MVVWGVPWTCGEISTEQGFIVSFGVMPSEAVGIHERSATGADDFGF